MTIVFMYHGIYSTWQSNLHTCPIQQSSSASVYWTCFAICLIFWICLNDSEEMVNQISFHNPFKNQTWFINYLKASFKQLTENVNCNVIIEILSRKCCLFGFRQFLSCLTDLLIIFFVSELWIILISNCWKRTWIYDPIAEIFSFSMYLRLNQ